MSLLQFGLISHIHGLEKLYEARLSFGLDWSEMTVEAPNISRLTRLQLSVNKASFKRPPDHFAVWSRQIPAVASAQTAEFPLYSYHETEFKAKCIWNISGFFAFTFTKQHLLDVLCYFKLMLTNLSRCSKSPEVVVFNKWLSMELGHAGHCEIASFKH